MFFASTISIVWCGACDLVAAPSIVALREPLGVLISGPWPEGHSERNADGTRAFGDRSLVALGRDRRIRQKTKAHAFNQPKKRFKANPPLPPTRREGKNLPSAEPAIVTNLDNAEPLEGTKDAGDLHHLARAAGKVDVLERVRGPRACPSCHQNAIRVDLSVSRFRWRGRYVERGSSLLYQITGRTCLRRACFIGAVNDI